MRKLWIAVLILYLPALGAVQAQTSLTPLPAGKPGVGFGIHSGIKLLGAFEYGITDYSKVVLETGFLWDENDIEKTVFFDVLFPPAFRLLRIKELWKSGLESFTSLGLDVNFREYTITLTEQNIGPSRFGGGVMTVLNTTSHVTRDERTIGLDAGAGVLKRLKTDSQWVFTPYLGLFYDVAWVTWDDSDREGFGAGVQARTTEDESNFSGNATVQLGIEGEVSPSFSVRSGFAFSLTSTNTDFHIGVNYHIN